MLTFIEKTIFQHLTSAYRRNSSANFRYTAGQRMPRTAHGPRPTAYHTGISVYAWFVLKIEQSKKNLIWTQADDQLQRQIICRTVDEKLDILII